MNENILEKYNRCLFCNQNFSEGDEVSIYRSGKNEMGLVHKSCVDSCDYIKNNYRDESIESVLGSNEKLWRYMDFSKFVCLLKDAAIYFSSPKCFDDIFEGAHGELRNKWEWNQFYKSFFISSIITAPDNTWHKIDEKTLMDQSEKLLNSVSEKPGKGIYISCWHNNNYESEAMWKLYSKDMNQAIAIQTTYGLLNKAIGDKAIIKKVKYIDYSKSFVGTNDVYWYKRKSFEHENEVRAIIRDNNNQASGLSIKVNLDSLIQKIYISPYASIWFKSVVKDVITKYGYSFMVNESSLSEIPF